MEYEPTLNSDNTEVKVPVHGNMDDNQGQSTDEKMTEYSKLVSIFRDLPTEMFVTRILKEYSNCESNLNRTRYNLFDRLRENDDYPFDQQSDLKRRVASKKGEPVTVKLAHDVHTLLCVLEGDEYSLIRDILSTRSRQTHSVSTLNFEIKTPVRSMRQNTSICMSNDSPMQATPMSSTRPVSDKTNSCICINEIKLLKDTMSSLQSEIVMLKQSNIATEKLRSKQITEIKNTLSAVKDDIILCRDRILNDITTMNNTSPALNRTYSEKLNTLSEKVHDLESFIDTNSVVAIHKIPLPDNIGQKNIDDGSNQDGNVSTDQPVTQHYTDIEHCEHQIETADIGIQYNLLTPVGNHYALNRPTVIQKDRHKNTHPDRLSYNYDHNIEIHTSDPNEIPVRISSRAINNDTEDEEFTTYVKRKTKRFFVNGFKRTITEDKIRKYVSRRGPKVSTIRIFPKKRAEDEVIIRLNVEPDSNCDKLLSDSFWPTDVYCTEWLSRRQLTNRHYSNSTYYDAPPRMRHLYDINVTDNDSSSTHEWRNRFDPLQTWDQVQ
ncbi:hypothetical protein ACF0H5_019485 [Mactra antiquata]